MYFPLEIKEQLANAEIGIFKKQEETRSEKRVCLESVEELGDILCDVTCRIASLTSSVISACAIDECNKEIMNHLTLESNEN